MENVTCRHTERVIDALRRGETVTLEGPETLHFQAAEAWLASPRGAAEALILAGPRMRYLGWTQEGQALRIGAPEDVEALLFSREAALPASAAAAGAAEAYALDLVKASGALPAAVAVGAAEDALRVTLDEAEGYFRERKRARLRRLPEVRLPVRGAEDARAAGFSERDGMTHLALLIGRPEAAEAPLARLHSSCVTGDILGSLRCDCGDQLKAAIAAMRAEGAGVLLYLNQEGRGIGLAAKLRAYRLQEEGLDTVDANRALGFADDERDFSLAADMLAQLGFRTIRLLTNNPHKEALLTAHGIRIAARAPLIIPPEPHNARYLDTKKRRMDHLL